MANKRTYMIVIWLIGSLVLAASVMLLVIEVRNNPTVCNYGFQINDTMFYRSNLTLPRSNLSQPEYQPIDSI